MSRPKLVHYRENLGFKTKLPGFRDRSRQRRGSVFALMAFLLPVLFILAAFCVNSAYMQLTQTELTIATDAAARAGGRAMSEFQTVADAKSAAQVTAALNFVGGQPLQLQLDDNSNEMEFGFTTQPNGLNGRFEFQKLPTAQVESGLAIASAFKVTGRRTGGSASGEIPLPIPGLLNITTFAPSRDAVAMQVDRDISLVLDRSGSMLEIDFNWPSGTSPWFLSTINAGVQAGLVVQHWGNYYYAPGQNSITYQQWAWQDHYQLGPAPQTLWVELLAAVDAFLNVLGTTPQDEQVSIATYASNASINAHLNKNFNAVRGSVASINPNGMTAIGVGMQAGIQTLLSSSARPYAAKTMVVMTDGIHNSGISPQNVATTLASQYNLVIHTVTFGSGANQNTMQQVAMIGGGKHYHAANGAQLVEVFEEIANNLPTIVTK